MIMVIRRINIIRPAINQTHCAMLRLTGDAIGQVRVVRVRRVKSAIGRASLSYGNTAWRGYWRSIDADAHCIGIDAISFAIIYLKGKGVIILTAGILTRLVT